MSSLIPLEHPGVILKEEFLEELEAFTPYAVSKATGISQTALGEILKGKRGISPQNALKLSKYLGMSESFFINLQTHYNLELAKESHEGSLATAFKTLSKERAQNMVSICACSPNVHKISLFLCISFIHHSLEPKDCKALYLYSSSPYQALLSPTNLRP